MHVDDCRLFYMWEVPEGKVRAGGRTRKGTFESFDFIPRSDFTETARKNTEYKEMCM